MKFPKVLLIDNDTFYINLHRLKLTAEGFVVEVAHDGNNGLKKLTEFKPDVILLELALPNLDGFDFLKGVNNNSDFKGVPIIVLSRLTQESDINRAKKLGACEFFSKDDFDFKVLSEEILKLVTKPIVKKQRERERERERERMPLKTILLGMGIIKPEELEEAEKIAKAKNLPLSEILVEKDLISDWNLGKLIADSEGLPFINLRRLTIPDDVLKIIPEVVAKKQKIIAFKKDQQGLHLAMADPTNIQIRSFVEKKVGLPLVVYYATERDIDNALNLYRKDVKETFNEIIAESVEKAKGTTKAEPPIIKIVDALLSYADQNKASDIHIEPQEEESVVRFRIDGILHDIVDLPAEIHPQIITRVKVMAHLRTDEHQVAQDGKLVFKTEREKLDIRVSIVPITEGEKVVMRLLSEKSRQFGLEDLGIETEDLKKVKTGFQKPYGMLLSTGPTGCGKTSTQYSILKILNKRDVNIMTIEDPVEYDIEGVNQIQVNPKTELTFAKGLRSLVRQDPDIILVGEIRDNETAGIAVNAGMTGHLVLSTLHTNDAATSLPRLLDMEVEPFLIASTVNVIIAQRLVRKICTKCIESVTQKREELEKHLSKDLISKYFAEKKEIRVYHGKGCPVCHQTDYVGRIGIFEVMEMAENIRKAVVDRSDADTIRKLAIANGMTTMLEDGLRKVIKGTTTIEEVLRVTKEQ